MHEDQFYLSNIVKISKGTFDLQWACISQLMVHTSVAHVNVYHVAMLLNLLTYCRGWIRTKRFLCLYLYYFLWKQYIFINLKIPWFCRPNFCLIQLLQFFCFIIISYKASTNFKNRILTLCSRLATFIII